MVLLIPLFLILTGFALRTALNLIYGVRGPDPGDQASVAMGILIWCMIGLGLAFMMIVPLGLSAFGVGIVFSVIAGFAIVDTVLASRQSSRRMNAKLLSIAQREGQLEHSLDLMQQMNSGRFVGRPTRQLCIELQAGQPLYDSTVRNHRSLPKEAPAYVAVGSLASAEPDALDALSEPEPTEVAVAWKGWLDYLAYALGMFIMMSVLFTFLAIKIIPEFNMIFEEFDLDLPPMTELLVVGTGGISLFGLLGAGSFLLLFALGVIGFFYLLDIDLLRGLNDRLKGRTRSAAALRLLAFAIEHKVELNRAIYALAVTYPSRITVRQLNGCYKDIEKGIRWTEALESNQLLHPDERALLDTADQVGNVPWALQQIAHQREVASSMRMNLIGRFVFPLLVLGLASIVAYVVVALFVPLVFLIQALG